MQWTFLPPYVDSDTSATSLPRSILSQICSIQHTIKEFSLCDVPMPKETLTIVTIDLLPLQKGLVLGNIRWIALLLA